MRTTSSGRPTQNTAVRGQNSRTQSTLSQELCERVPWKTQYGLSSPTRGFVQHALGGKTYLLNQIVRSL